MYLRGFLPSSYRSNSQKAFTLIELLVTIGILAVLATVTVLVINPAQLFAQARDSRRLSDLQTINGAMKFVSLQGLSEGSANTVYISIPDSSATCANLGLPALPAGYAYACATAANFRKVDGTGWIPVNFTQLSTGSPLPTLPIDPINTTSTGNYYTYVPGGSYALTSLLESQKYLSENAFPDGGTDAGRFEIGTDLSLWADASGLVGYWKFDEGSGTIAMDSSGSGRNGTLSGTATWTTGKIGRGILTQGMNSDDYVDLGTDSSLNPSRFTVAAWVNPADISGSYNYIYSNARDCCGTYNGIEFRIVANRLSGIIWNGTASVINGNAVIDNNSGWRFVVMSYDGTNAKVYLDGSLDSTSVPSLGVGTPASFNAHIGSMGLSGTYALDGVIDEVSLYNRALSAAEITALYNATR